jgi:anti-sigma regulatory factor (Ser/Thr protein kinase)
VTAEEGRPGRALGDGTAPAGIAPLDQAFDAGSLYALRAAVAARAAAAGFGRREVYEVTAVAHELAANAVIHGAGHGRLRLRADDGFLYCEVSDDGQAPADGAVAPGNGTAPWPAEHGHGLWLAGQVTDQLSISHGPGGTTVTVRFALRSR